MEFKAGDIVIRDMGNLKSYTIYGHGHGSIGEVIEKTSLGNYLVKIIKGDNFMVTGSEQPWSPKLTKPYILSGTPDWEI